MDGELVPTPNRSFESSQTRLELASKLPPELNCICPVDPAGVPPPPPPPELLSAIACHSDAESFHFKTCPSEGEPAFTSDKSLRSVTELPDAQLATPLPLVVKTCPADPADVGRVKVQLPL